MLSLFHLPARLHFDKTSEHSECQRSIWVYPHTVWDENGVLPLLFDYLKNKTRVLYVVIVGVVRVHNLHSKVELKQNNSETKRFAIGQIKKKNLFLEEEKN